VDVVFYGNSGAISILLAGNTQETGLIVTPGAFQMTSTDGGCCAYGEGFVAKIAPQSTAAVALVVSPSPSQSCENVPLTGTVSKSTHLRRRGTSHSRRDRRYVGTVALSSNDGSFSPAVTDA
jgi:hypothetical protein